MRSDKSQGDKRFSKSRVFRIFYFFISTFNFKDVYFCLDLKFLNEGNTRMKKGIRCRIQFAGAVGWQAYRGRHGSENL